MSGYSLLTHKKGDCGGQISIDVTQSLKLLAPAFRMGVEGCTNLTLDFKVEADGKINPQWICAKCSQNLSKQDLEKDAYSTCQVCGNEHSAHNLAIHPLISSICNECCDDIKKYLVTGKTSSDSVVEYVQGYNITLKNFKPRPMVEVLLLPITI